MTDDLKAQIKKLRFQRLTFSKIGFTLNIPTREVSAVCKELTLQGYKFPEPIYKARDMKHYTFLDCDSVKFNQNYLVPKPQVPKNSDQIQTKPITQNFHFSADHWLFQNQ